MSNTTSATTYEYEHVCASIKRWRSRLKRAMTMLDKLEKKQKRLERKLTQPEPMPAPPVPKVTTAYEIVEDDPADDDIPGFLRVRTAEVQAEVRAAEVQAEVDAEKKRKADLAAKKRAIKQEHVQAELTGKRRRMPLTGKDALAAIRDEG